MGLNVGDVVGDYQVVGVLGAGGMGQVYQVRNTISDRVEAMKILLPNLESDPELMDRFLREIKVQASLDHPNIAALHTAQRVGNQLLMFMEYVEGEPLESVLKRGPVPVAQGVDYISQVAAALAYAHARGVIHRDIKPANMMLMPDGTVKLMDFGIAKAAADRRLTQTGRTVGSLYYMSPSRSTAPRTWTPGAICTRSAWRFTRWSPAGGRSRATAIIQSWPRTCNRRRFRRSRSTRVCLRRSTRSS